MSGSPPPLPSGSALCTAQYEREGGGGQLFFNPGGAILRMQGGRTERPSGVGVGKKIVLTPPLQSIFLSFLGPPLVQHPKTRDKRPISLSRQKVEEGVGLFFSMQ